MSIDERVRQRLEGLDDTLELYYDKLNMYQSELAITESVDIKFSIKHRIKREVLPYIKKYEIEYVQLLLSEIKLLHIPEAEVKEILDEIQRIIESAEQLSKSEKSDELTKLLTEAQDKLYKPSVTASAKLVATLPILPGIIAYQLELETGSILLQIWKKIKTTFKRRIS